MNRYQPTKPTLRTQDGRRKYLNAAERTRFIAMARTCPRPEVATLCLLLAYSGCRISEALAVHRAHVDREAGTVTIRSLKKRGARIFREVPLPDDVVDALLAIMRDETWRWPFKRERAWQLVKEVMAASGIGDGPHATPKGLRHAFGVHAVRCKVPLNLLQRWLGHASLVTTAIYADVMGEEERELARLMW